MARRVLDRLDHITLSSRQGALTGRLPSFEPLDLELREFDLLLQVPQELPHAVPFLNGRSEGSLEFQAKLLLLLWGHHLRGFDQRRELILD